ncbi:LOB domain-containing protein 22-like [Gastrolobium bilobum]|uniref:LOB domain-containing protein 22-like n=1 Tax=Gastrolobium bilobum TaxID=150636 RepID=UPI002AB1F27B|nr:LOB domain-containing protein 22-like [Gastrolobium bilobum]
MRASDPVGGCYRYIQDLQANIEYYRAELELVLQQLAIFRSQAQQQQHHVYGTSTIMAHENNENNINNNNTPLQEHVNTWAMQNSMSLSSLSLQGQNSNASDEYDHKPMLDIPSDERSELGFESEELIHRR